MWHKVQNYQKRGRLQNESEAKIVCDPIQFRMIPFDVVHLGHLRGGMPEQVGDLLDGQRLDRSILLRDAVDEHGCEGMPQTVQPTDWDVCTIKKPIIPSAEHVVLDIISALVADQRGILSEVCLFPQVLDHVNCRIVQRDVPFTRRAFQLSDFAFGSLPDLLGSLSDIHTFHPLSHMDHAVVNVYMFEVGGKFTPGIPGPIKAMGRVRSLHDGFFRQEGPAGKGFANDCGKTAVISFGSIDMMVCEKPGASGDPQILRHFGIEPKLYDLIVVKANTSFKVAYAPFAGVICAADTPGAGASNLGSLKWTKLPRGLYPFDLPDDHMLAPARIWKK